MNSRNLRALVIAPQPFFTPRGTPFSVYYRTMICAGEGVQIDLLTYGQGQDVDIPGVRIIRIPRFKWLGPVPVGPSKLKLFLDGFILLKTLWLLCRNRYDFVHAHEEAVFFCTFLKPIFGFKLVYDMHSCLPQQLTNFKFTTSGKMIRLFKWLEDKSTGSADAVITICPELADYALSLISDKGKHFLIENSIFDPVRLKSPGRADAVQATAPEPPVPPAGRYVVYAGTFEAYQGLDILVAAFAQVIRSVPDAFLLLVGGSPGQVVKYREMADAAGLKDRCLVLERVPQAAARRYCEAASVQVSPRSSGTNTPLKTYEQLASGIPIVATRIRSHTQVLSEDVAYLVDPNPDAMAAGIIQAFADGRTGNARAANALKLYADRYSRPAYVAKIRQLLERLTPCAE
ncbi:MAG: glycosyltransferase [bacterium]